jgi:hypothetical protein
MTNKMETTLKIWTNKKSNEDNFIVYDGKSLHRARVKKEAFDKITRALNKGEIDKKFISVPMSYIKHMEYREDDPKIRIYYGQDSEEELKVSDQALREDIFNYLKVNTDVKETKQEKPPVLSRIKKPLIALFVLIGIFIYVSIIIDGLNSGYEYELRGSGKSGLGALVLGLAQFGMMKNLMLFVPLGSIALYMIYKRSKNNSEIHYLVYK